MLRTPSHPHPFAAVSLLPSSSFIALFTLSACASTQHREPIAASAIVSSPSTQTTPSATVPVCRVKLLTPLQLPARPPETLSNPPALVNSACDALDQNRRQALMTVTTAIDAAALDNALVPSGCLPSTKGAWGFRYLRVNLSASHTLEADVVAVYVTPSGRTLDATSPVHVQSGNTSTRVHAVITDDWDQDGVSELVYKRETLYPSGSLDYQTEILTVRNGAVVSFVPYAASIETVDDIDQDGRLDLVLRGRPLVSHACASQPHEIQGPTRLLHAQVNGSFRDDDSVAFNHLASRCPERPTLLRGPLALKDLDAHITSFGCALSWGDDPAPWLAALRTFAAAHSCIDLEALEHTIATPDPSNLRLACSTPRP